MAGAVVTAAVFATGLTGCVNVNDIGGTGAAGNSGTVWTVPFSAAELHLTVENAKLKVRAGGPDGTLSISSGRYHSATGAPTPVVHDDTVALADPCPSGSVADCSGNYSVSVPAGVAVDVTGSNSPTTVYNLTSALTVRLNPCTSLKVQHVSGPLTLSCTGGDADSTGITATELDSATVSAAESAAPGAGGGLYLGFDAPPTSVTATYDGGPPEALTVEVPQGPWTYRIDGRTRYPGLTSDPASSRIIRVGGGRMIGVFRWPNTWPPPS